MERQKELIKRQDNPDEKIKLFSIKKDHKTLQLRRKRALI